MTDTEASEVPGSAMGGKRPAVRSVYLSAPAETTLTGLLVKQFSGAGYFILGPLAPANQAMPPLPSPTAPAPTTTAPSEPSSSADESSSPKQQTESVATAAAASTTTPAMGPQTPLELCQKADVVLLDVRRGGDCESAKSLLQAFQTSADIGTTPKQFIILSSAMTWATTSSSSSSSQDTSAANAADPASGGETMEQEPYAEEDYRKRKPHPNYKKQLFIEKYAMTKVKRDGVSVYVVCAGVTYGNGEEPLHWLFRAAWEGTPKQLPTIGSGKNFVPTIHVQDLATALFNTAENPPQDDRYILAVDTSNNTQLEIVTAISKQLGTGQVKPVSPAEALLMAQSGGSPAGIAQQDMDLIQADLRFESLVMRDLVPSGSWIAETGLVENIAAVVQQYRVTRGLLPLKIVIIGAPASGKTVLAEAIAKHYSVHHLVTKQVIEEVLKDPVNQLLAEEVMEAKDPATGRYNDAHMADIFKHKLHGWQCQNQGFVLDGFPKTATQAENLFRSDSTGDQLTSDGSGGGEAMDEEIKPDHVFLLEAPDDMLRQRVMNMPQSQVTGTHNTEEGFGRRLGRWRGENTPEEGVGQWLEAHGILPVPLQASAPVESLLELVIREVGAPHRYGPSAEEVEESKRQAEKQAKEAAEKAAKEQAEREAKEKEARAATQAAWEKRLVELRTQENELLQARSLPFRRYLMDTVMPTLSKALVELAEVRPSDPIDYLAEFMLRAAYK